MSPHGAARAQNEDRAIHSMHVAIIDGDCSFPATSGKRMRTLHLMLEVARRHRITYVGRCAADSDEARLAPAFLRERGIEPILVHHPIARKSGPAFYARLAANLLSSLPYSVASHQSDAMKQAIDALAIREPIDLWQFEWAGYLPMLDPAAAGPARRHRSQRRYADLAARL